MDHTRIFDTVIGLKDIESTDKKGRILMNGGHRGGILMCLISCNLLVRVVHTIIDSNHKLND